VPLANIIQNAFGPLINLFEAVLVFLHNSVVGGSWGLSIIALTVVVRAALVPLTLSQFRSMQNMQRVAPEIKALQAKYKEDKQRLNEEMMKFYREKKINPFASCIPLLLQFPVFISLFYALRSNLKLDICGQQLRQHFHVLHNNQIPSGKLQSISCDAVAPHSAKFLFIPDITHKTTGAVLVVLLVLYVGSQLASSVMMSATADANQRRLMIALPFFFTIFIFSFPGGLLVYWITTNLWTIGQQYFVRRQVGPPPAPPQDQKGKPPQDSPRGGPKAPRRAEPELAGVGARGGGGGGAGGPAPPRPPRKKKKRSGRRR
jgi:YidC/Oxa1 family membrane protein insertase